MVDKGMYMGGKEGKLGGLMGEMKQVRMGYGRKEIGEEGIQ